MSGEPEQLGGGGGNRAKLGGNEAKPFDKSARSRCPTLSSSVTTDTRMLESMDKQTQTRSVVLQCTQVRDGMGMGGTQGLGRDSWLGGLRGGARGEEW